MTIGTVLRSLAAIAVVMSLQMVLIGCNTVKGAGQDIEAAGDTIEKTAEKTKSY